MLSPGAASPNDAEIGEAGLPTLVAGRYQILECIGEGGMGIVCRGFDLDLEETVAVKFLRADLADDESLRARFRREVKLARRVTHPHVARVFEFGRDGALCFLTMEFIPGESLQALLRRDAPLPPQQVFHLAVRLCEGLAAAHAAGVVHGDIKPGNVLVAPIRGAVLTDFGIAHALNDGTLADGNTTGTPFYMAPEQARGESMQPQTDVYSVGVVLFEALTGQNPWPDSDALGLLASKRRGHEPDLARVAPNLPPAWSRLISECLRSDPAQRPADARAVLARLTAMRDAPPPAVPTVAHATPLNASDGPRWLSVEPLDAPAALAWLAADLMHALGQIRGLRVRTGTSPLVAPAAVVRGRAHTTDSGDVAVHLTLELGDRTATISVRQPRAALHQLGAELAARVAAALDRTAAPPRRDPLDADVSALYVEARHAYQTMHVDRSLQLFEAALARAPDHPLLRLGHTLARVQETLLFREASVDEIAALQAAVDEAVARHGELGESHLAHARISLALGDAPAAARSLCTAIARAPSLVEAYNLLVDLLIDIGRLPDAARRLEISLALDRTTPQAWGSQIRLDAYLGDWDAFYDHVDGNLSALKFRTVAVPRLMLWHPRPGCFEKLEQVLAHNSDDLQPTVHLAARLVVAFALGREPRERVLDRLEMFSIGSSNMRRNCFVAQVNCELACAIGDYPRARAHLLTADRWLLTDIQWLLHCPVLGPLRDDPAFAAVREHVQARADAVAEAIWG